MTRKHYNASGPLKQIFPVEKERLLPAADEFIDGHERLDIAERKATFSHLGKLDLQWPPWQNVRTA